MKFRLPAWPFKRQKQQQVISLLDQPLIYFSEYDAFSIRDACEGVQIFGGIGSGKTSGSGRALALSFLNSGFGGVVMTAKPDETELWLNYAHQTGRTNDLIVVNPDNNWCFDFMGYELNRAGRGAGLTENIVNLFSVIVEVAERGKGGSDNEAFWRNEQRKLLRNAIDLLRLARSKITLSTIYDVIMSAPLSPDDVEDTDWRQGSFCCQMLLAANTYHSEGFMDTDSQRDWRMCLGFWSKEFPNMAERTRATVISIFTGMADTFLRGLLPRLFCENTTYTPDDTLDGKIIILDLPVKMYNEIGLYAQVLFKYCWQRAIERRIVRENSRPVFLWADESHTFVNEYDVTFQTTARSARACTVFLTQNLPNYFYSLGGGERTKSLVDSVLGNLTTKIFHNNTCSTTNQYAADQFSKEWQSMYSSSSSVTGQNSVQSGTSTSKSLEYSILPRDFTGLIKGGSPNNYAVEAIIYQGGKVFNGSETNALKTLFYQG